MRSLRFSRFGSPTDVLTLEDMPIPEPKTGEVLLRLTHRAINPSDLYTLMGFYGVLPTLPATPGFEGMGKIEGLGEGVQGWSVGQRVIPLMDNTGTWQEYITVKASQLIPIPDAVSDQTAAQFIVNPVTAWVMLTEELGLQQGDWVLQTAAGSTLGRIVLQLSQLLGYKTINLVRRREQIDELLALGADAVICTEDDVVSEVMKLTGKGVKGAIEAVGGETGATTVRCLRSGGKMLIYGVLSNEAIPLNAGEMLFKGTSVEGFWLSWWMRSKPQDHVASVLAKLMNLMAEGHLVPPIEKEYDLSEYKAAVIHANTPGRSGKILFVG